MAPVRLIQRLRGRLLRATLRRRTAFLLGTAVAAPAVWLMSIDAPWEPWITDGLALVAVATGIALVHTSLTGRRADWAE